MSYVTVEVDIEHGRIVPREPAKVPEKATGLLTILPVAKEPVTPKEQKERVELPLIQGDGKRLINPSPEELDASTWGD
ncbi:MAG: hypothetical protein JWM16_3765 [Verrucomicrobiales bacterium]|nr:hypothetical protein [Verrucomicrobiales bacterium]